MAAGSKPDLTLTSRGLVDRRGGSWVETAERDNDGHKVTLAFRFGRELVTGITKRLRKLRNGTAVADHEVTGTTAGGVLGLVVHDRDPEGVIDGSGKLYLWARRGDAGSSVALQMAWNGTVVTLGSVP